MANNLYEGGIMKKVLVIFLLLFALLNVKAYTFSEWQEVFPKNVKEEIIQSEERLEELADMLEVIRALALLEDKDIQSVINIMDKKREKRGGFTKKLFLEKTMK